MALSFSKTGILTCKPEHTNQPFGKYVFQKTVAGLGNDQSDRKNKRQVRRWVSTPNPNTINQQNVRANFRAAISAWQALSTADKTLWVLLGRKKRRTGYNLFISKQLR